MPKTSRTSSPAARRHAHTPTAGPLSMKDHGARTTARISTAAITDGSLRSGRPKIGSDDVCIRVLKNRGIGIFAMSISLFPSLLCRFSNERWLSLSLAMAVAQDVVVLGSYERFLVGYSLDNGGGALKRRFCLAAHLGPVRCVAAGTPPAQSALVVSGGADDTLRAIDVRAMKDRGALLSPPGCGEGDVMCVALFVPRGETRPAHVFSGGQDGGIGVWEAQSLDHVKTLREKLPRDKLQQQGAVKAKKARSESGIGAGVTGLAVHATGCVLLSASEDKSMRMWNLSTGRCTYRHRLDARAEHLSFLSSAGGARGDDTYAMCFNASGPGEKSRTVIHDAESGAKLTVLEHSSRVNDFTQHRGLVTLGHEDGGISGWDIRINNTATERPAVRLRHATGSKRIRGLSSMPVSELLCSGSSDGVIKVWDARMFSTSSGEHNGSDAGSSCVAEAHSRARISCLAVGVSSASVHPPRKTRTEPSDVDIDGYASKGEMRSKKKKEEEEEEEEKTAYDDGYDMRNGNKDKVDGIDDEYDEHDDQGRRRRSIDALRGSIVSKRAFDKSKSRLKRRLRLRSSLMAAVSTRLQGGSRVNSVSPGFRSIP